MKTGKTMNDRHIYIKSMDMIPSGDSFSDYSAFLTPMEGRRMGKLMKRALATSLTALRNAGLEHSDAIITGTSLGSVADMEPVLESVCENGGESVKPTNFMQSTHNTPGSLIALKTGTHGYNCTWSQEALSFENALADAMTQLRLGRIGSALVGAFDELSPNVLEVQRRGGMLKDGCLAGEVAASFLLETGGAAGDGQVEAAAVRTAYIPDEKFQADELSAMLEDMLGKAGLSMGDIDLVLTGRHGTCSGAFAGNSSRKSHPCPYDAVYDRLNGLWQGAPQGLWKHVFGEGFSSSAAGFHTAAACLRHGFIPDRFLFPVSMPSCGPSCEPASEASCETSSKPLCETSSGTSRKTLCNIVVFNHFAAKHFSLMLLRGLS